MSESKPGAQQEANQEALRTIDRSTLGIPPAHRGALNVLQFSKGEPFDYDTVAAAAREVAFYHSPVGDQAERHARLSQQLAAFLVEIVGSCPPGPERSTAISRARESKMWASAAVALEGK